MPPRLKEREEGIEWLVDASGCNPRALRDRRRLHDLFVRLVNELDLHPVGSPQWLRFPKTGGLTGVWLLRESHLACHTFPEFGSLCLSLFCCRPREAKQWNIWLRTLGPSIQLRVRRIPRHYVHRREKSAC